MRYNIHLTKDRFLRLMAILTLLIVVNMIGYLKPVRWDVTEAKIFSVSQTTKDVLTKLDQPISVQGFLTNSFPSRIRVEQLLDNYVYQAPTGFFTYTIIDPDANPVLAQEAAALKDGSIILTMGDRTEQITFINEEEITSAILRLISPIETNIYFLTGHGEYEPQGTDSLSYGFVQQALAAKNHNIGKLNLLTTGIIPDDASSIVIAGPQKPFLDVEIQILGQYLENGGNLVILLEPAFSTDITSEDDLLGEYFRNQYGIVFQKDVILDPNMQPPVIVVAEFYGEHPIIEKLAATATIFPTANSLLLIENESYDAIIRTQLILTSATAWGETSDDEIVSGTPVYTPGRDFQGPLAVAVSCENLTTGSKVIVVGDSDFGSNAYFQEYANGDLIVNIIEWTARITKSGNFAAATETERKLKLPSNLSLGAILITTVFILPSVFIIAGVTTILQQRKSRMQFDEQGPSRML